jgi:hypothetical protein
MTHTTTTPTAYVPPALKPLGTLSDLTQGAGLMNSDNGNQIDTAYPNPS